MLLFSFTSVTFPNFCGKLNKLETQWVWGIIFLSKVYIVDEFSVSDIFIQIQLTYDSSFQII